MKRFLAFLCFAGTALAQPSSPQTQAVMADKTSGALVTPTNFWTGNATAIGSALSGTFQPLDSDLTAIAALATTVNGRSLLTASSLTLGGLGLTDGVNAVTPTNLTASITGHTLTVSLPQAIGTGSSPTFAGLTLTSPLSVGNGGTGAITAVSALQNLGGFGATESAKSASFTVTSAGNGFLYQITTGPTACTVTFDGTTLFNGFRCILRKADAGTGLITTSPTTSPAATSLGKQGHVLEIYCDGANYYARFIGGGNDSGGNYTFSAYSTLTLNSGASTVIALNGAQIGSTGNSIQFTGGSSLSDGGAGTPTIAASGTNHGINFTSNGTGGFNFSGSNASAYIPLNITNSASTGFAQINLTSSAAGTPGTASINYQAGGFLGFSVPGAEVITFGIGGNEKLRLSNGGNLLIGGTTDISGGGGLKVFGTTNATSTTTGAFQVAGGASILGSLYLGNTLFGTNGNFGNNFEIGSNGGGSLQIDAPSGGGAGAAAYVKYNHLADGVWWAVGADNTTGNGNRFVWSRAGDLSNPLMTLSTTGILTVNNITLAGGVSGSIGSNGSAQLGESTTLGGVFIGKGSTNDLSFQNSAGAVAISIPTGTTNVGVAGNLTAPTLNSLTVSTSTGTLTLTNAKTFSVSNTLTLAGTDGSTLNVGAGGTLASGAFAAAYTLPIATTSTLGGVKVDGTTITIASGVISSSGSGTNSPIFRATFNGSGSAIPATNSNGVGLPYAYTVHGWQIIGDVSGSITIDVQTSSDGVTWTSITAAAKPALSSAVVGASTVLTGWTTSLSAGTYIRATTTGSTTSTVESFTLY